MNLLNVILTGLSQTTTQAPAAPAKADWSKVEVNEYGMPVRRECVLVRLVKWVFGLK